MGLIHFFLSFVLFALVFCFTPALLGVFEICYSRTLTLIGLQSVIVLLDERLMAIRNEVINFFHSEFRGRGLEDYQRYENSRN